MLIVNFLLLIDLVIHVFSFKKCEYIIFINKKSTLNVGNLGKMCKFAPGK